MQSKNQPWPPKVGDQVRIKETPFRGVVLKTKGVHEARFQLQVPALTTDGAKPTPVQARAARIASHWYGLDELEPTGDA
jgi:transcription antitermination factor NusG